MDRIGMLGIGVVLTILGAIIVSGILDWLIDLSGLIMLVIGIILVVLGLIKTFSGSESDY
jgi:hypothetical protein